MSSKQAPLPLPCNYPYCVTLHNINCPLSIIWIGNFSNLTIQWYELVMPQRQSYQINRLYKSSITSPIPWSGSTITVWRLFGCLDVWMNEFSCRFTTSKWLIDMGTNTVMRWSAPEAHIETAVLHKPLCIPTGAEDQTWRPSIGIAAC